MDGATTVSRVPNPCGGGGDVADLPISPASVPTSRVPCPPPLSGPSSPVPGALPVSAPPASPAPPRFPVPRPPPLSPASASPVRPPPPNGLGAPALTVFPVLPSPAAVPTRFNPLLRNSLPLRNDAAFPSTRSSTDLVAGVLPAPPTSLPSHSTDPVAGVPPAPNSLPVPEHDDPTAGVPPAFQSPSDADRNRHDHAMDGLSPVQGAEDASAPQPAGQHQEVELTEDDDDMGGLSPAAPVDPRSYADRGADAPGTADSDDRAPYARRGPSIPLYAMVGPLTGTVRALVDVPDGVQAALPARAYQQGRARRLDLLALVDCARCLVGRRLQSLSHPLSRSRGPEAHDALRRYLERDGIAAHPEDRQALTQFVNGMARRRGDGTARLPRAPWVCGRCSTATPPLLLVCLSSECRAPFSEMASNPSLDPPLGAQCDMGDTPQRLCRASSLMPIFSAGRPHDPRRGVLPARPRLERQFDCPPPRADSTAG